MLPEVLPSMPTQVLVPPLREMEAYVFDQMVRLLWRTLVEVRPGFREKHLASEHTAGQIVFPDARQVV